MRKQIVSAIYNIDMNNIHVLVDFRAQVSSEKSQ